MATFIKYLIVNPLSRATFDDSSYEFEIQAAHSQIMPIGRNSLPFLIDWANELKAALNEHFLDDTDVHTAASALTVAAADATSLATAITLVEDTTGIRAKYEAHRIEVAGIHAHADTLYTATTNDMPEAESEYTLFNALEWISRAYMRHRVHDLLDSSLGTIHGLGNDFFNPCDYITLHTLRPSGEALPSDGGKYRTSTTAFSDWEMAPRDVLDLDNIYIVCDVSNTKVDVFNYTENIVYIYMSGETTTTQVSLGGDPMLSQILSENQSWGPGQ